MKFTSINALFGIANAVTLKEASQVQNLAQVDAVAECLSSGCGGCDSCNTIQPYFEYGFSSCGLYLLAYGDYGSYGVKGSAYGGSLYSGNHAYGGLHGCALGYGGHYASAYGDALGYGYGHGHSACRCCACAP